MANERRLLIAEVIEHTEHIGTELVVTVGVNFPRTGTAAISAHVYCSRSKACVSQCLELVSPTEPQTRVAMAHYHEWAGALVGNVKLYAVRLELQMLKRPRHLSGLPRFFKFELQSHRYYVADGFQACHSSQCFDAAVELKISGIDEHRVCRENQ